MKHRAKFSIIVLLPILILGMLIINARVMSTQYIILQGSDQTTKKYGEQFSVTNQTIENVQGQTLSINVLVKNTSSFIWTHAGVNPVQMSYHILDENKKVINYEGLRVNLPDDLRPSQQVTLPLTVKELVQPGNYFIQLDMVQEGMTWFEKRGGATYLLKIQQK